MIVICGKPPKRQRREVGNKNCQHSLKHLAKQIGKLENRMSNFYYVDLNVRYVYILLIYASLCISCNEAFIIQYQ